MLAHNFNQVFGISCLVGSSIRAFPEGLGVEGGSDPSKGLRKQTFLRLMSGYFKVDHEQVREFYRESWLQIPNGPN